MEAQDIETILNELKANSRGSIIGKNKAIDKIQSAHFKEIDSILTDIRIFVGKISTGHSSSDALKMVDEFIYNLQIK